MPARAGALPSFLREKATVGGGLTPLGPPAGTRAGTAQRAVPTSPGLGRGAPGHRGGGHAV